jgi:thiol-disulfide isomerase/thioredoxin
MDEDEKEYQKALNENVQKRMEQSLEEMRRARHQGSNASVDDDPDRAPTGEPYRRRRRMQQQALERDQQRRYCETQKQEQEYKVSLARQKENVLHSKNNESDDDDDDDDWFIDDDDDENAVLESIRQARLEEVKRQQVKRAENMAKGHGQYRTISQDEFLPECTSSDYVCVHFFHDEFERCKVMDFHLQQIAVRHSECKFVRIHATKAPFFVEKLNIKTLPTLLIFKDGKTVERLIGFDGVSIPGAKNPDEWPTGRLQDWLSRTGAIQYTKPTEEVVEEMKRLGLAPRGAIWRGGVDEYDDDDDE